MNPTIHLGRITIYPVKSCKGINLSRAELSQFGLLNDRRWMLVDADMVFLSQRRLPSMALIEPELSDSILRLKAPGAETIEIVRSIPNSKHVVVKVWNDDCEAYDCGDVVARWFTTFLDIDCRLVAMGNDFVRAVDSRYASGDDQVGFADAFPLLLISQASLDDLNSRLDTPVPMDRFRPNLVVEGCHPFAEDTWRKISVGDFVFRVGKPCARCTIPTVNQTTAERGKEPMQTLSQYRKGPDNKTFFGQNIVNEQKTGTIVVGSTVTILE